MESSAVRCFIRPLPEQIPDTGQSRERIANWAAASSAAVSFTSFVPAQVAASHAGFEQRFRQRFHGQSRDSIAIDIQQITRTNLIPNNLFLRSDTSRPDDFQLVIYATNQSQEASNFNYQRTFR